ncbi:MAG: hypothetical protein DWG80_05795 [Chloroflexi bacterium]|nr:hypothetical protein [Chloroflexota bacterium]
MAPDRLLPWPFGWVWLLLAALIVLGGFGVVALRVASTESYEPNRVLGSIALGAPYVVAGGIALAGIVRHRASLVTAGGMSAFVLATVSLVLWPLVVPAGALIVRSVSMARAVNLRGLLIVAGSFFGLLAAITVLVFGEDEAGGTLPGGGTWYASDVVTRGEALTALTITFVTAAAVAVLERSRR